MFSIAPFSISLSLLLKIYFSKANEVYINEYKDIQYPEYPQDFVIELPVYEPIRSHSLQNNMVQQTYVPLHFNEVETTTVSSIFHNKYEEPIMEANQNVQQFQEYIKIQTSNPEQITTQVPMIASTTNVNDSQESMIPIQITDEPEANQLISEFKIKYNKKSAGKKSFQTKSQQIKSPNRKREISKNLLQDPDIQNFKYNIKNSTNSQKNNKQIKKTKKRFRNRKNQENAKEFNGFGHTFKTLNSFLNTDKFFTDILKPIENNLDEIENKPIRPIKTNIYSLIAKAASLKNDDNDSSTQKNSDKKPISKKLHKRNNIVKKGNIETDSYLATEKKPHTDALEEKPQTDALEGKFLGREKRQEQLRKGAKNFKLTMKMLSNIDKYVSSMLQNYFEKLSNYIDDEENYDNEDEEK